MHQSSPLQLQYCDDDYESLYCAAPFQIQVNVIKQTRKMFSLQIVEYLSTDILF